MVTQNSSNINQAEVKNNTSTGILTGGIVTINGGDASKFDLSATIGRIVNNYTDPNTPVLTEISFSAVTAQTVTNIATTDVTFIGINSAGAIVQQSTVFTASDMRDIITVAALAHTGNTVIEQVNNFHYFIPDPGLQVSDLFGAIGPINNSGNIYSANGTNVNINKSSGSTFTIGANFQVSKKDPNNFADSAITTASFPYLYQDGAGSTITTAFTTSIDPDQYDDGSGTLAAVANNRFTIQRISFFTGGLPNPTLVEYGQNIYTSQAAAESAILTEDFVTSVILEDSSFRCWLIVKKGATDLSVAADAKFITAGKFGDLSGSGGVSATDLQGAYNNSSSPEIVLDTTRGALSVIDNATPIAAALLEVQNNAQTTTFFKADVNGAQIDGSLTITTDLAVAHGGTGLSTITDNAVMVGSGTSAITPLAVGTNGQVLLGSTAADPIFGTISSASGTITSILGAGSLDLAATPATTSQAGSSELATDAEVATGTDTARVSPISSMVHHQGVAKAWGNVDGGSGTPVFRDSYNITSLTDNGTGLYQINIATDMANDDYSITTGFNRVETTAVGMVNVYGVAVGDFDLSCTQFDGNFIDPTAVYFTVHGDR